VDIPRLLVRESRVLETEDYGLREFHHIYCLSRRERRSPARRVTSGGDTHLSP
jgi:hypothetical protein